MISQKTYLIEKIKTANVASLLVLIFDHVIAILLFFINVPKDNTSTFNLLVTAVLLPCTLGALYYLFQYKKKEDSEDEST